MDAFRKIDIDQFDEDRLDAAELYEADPRDPAEVLDEAKQRQAAVRSTLARCVVSRYPAAVMETDEDRVLFSVLLVSAISMGYLGGFSLTSQHVLLSSHDANRGNWVGATFQAHWLSCLRTHHTAPTSTMPR